ncbi:GNAT family N-acetyltransferase [Bacillus massiliigorillae]|uniref:GNAT family N-acetyltransferase n=1 Tax=Bacillus massiliigorillae TaxID=1243664 RepID=UPI00039BAB8C|nr:GNAT family N-acetyltransferase [Bacillus massiliigorillae]
MEFITVNQDNIEQEHICCAISDKKGETCVSSKKAWMKERFEDGLVFRKLNERGKVFIEYIPAEKAWYPITAEGYMHINCFWVSGKFKGQGIANQLLEQCIEDAKEKGKRGLTVLSSTKKMPFLSDPKYLKYKGFQVADTCNPYYELLYLPFDEEAPIPTFNDCAKQGAIQDKGMVLYYTNQCPHTDKYAPLLKEFAEKHGTTVTLHKIESVEQAQNAPAPFTTYSFFYDGKLVTNEIFSEKKFEKFLASIGK